MKQKITKPKCAYCERTLVPIGNKRSNGKPHNDWNSRKYHKKCFLIINGGGSSDNNTLL